MARKILGGLLLFFAIFGLIGSLSDDNPDAIVAGIIVIVIVFIIPGLLLLFIKGKGKEEKAAIKSEKQKAKDRRARTVFGEHMAGLPVAQGTNCTLIFEDDHIIMDGGGNSFRVSYDKITDLQIKTDVDIQKSYVSSVGGAVGGAVLFGPLGAMVGGRAKEKTTRTYDYYFIVTYNKDNAVEYISFRVFDYSGVSKLIQRYKPMLSGKSITIDL